MRAIAVALVALAVCGAALAGGGPVVITGTAEGETLRGGLLADRLAGLGGRDGLWGYGGDDLLDAGPGNDLLYAGRGDDRLAGRAGNDAADGGLGHDRITGGAGRDLVWGGPGNDRLAGGRDADLLYGNSGDDVIDARDGGRTLSDCPRPCWRSPPGAETVWAGAGDDRILARDGQLDAIRCESGSDVAVVDRRDRISPFGDCEMVLRR